jgi:hypothetical protein
MNINNEIKVEIKTYISQSSESQFYYDLARIEQKEHFKLLEAKYIIIQVFLQLGKSDCFESPVFDFRNKNEIYVNIQPKIKSYIIFKSEENYNKYKKEEMIDSDLYFTFKVDNGKIIK